MNDNLCRHLKGAFGFPVTPFRKDLSLDLDALAANVDAMASHPFCALVAAGGMGEIYSLSPAEVDAVIRVTVEAAKGRLPVLAGVGFNTPIAVESARAAAKAGVEALLVLPPYYTNAPEHGLFDYYAAIGHATDLPLIVYSRDWAAFTPQMVARLCDRLPTLAAWKDGQGDIRRFQRIVQYNGDRLAWFGGSGDDNASGYYSIGVQAFTSSLSNFAPRLSLAIANAGAQSDFTTLDSLMKRYVHPFFTLRERSKGYEVAAVKAAMTLLGLPAGPVRPPLTPLADADLSDLAELIRTFSDILG